MSKARKALVAVAGVLAVLGQVLADGAIDSSETGLLLTSIATAVGVYLFPNKTAARFIRAVDVYQ